MYQLLNAIMVVSGILFGRMHPIGDIESYSIA